MDIGEFCGHAIIAYNRFKIAFLDIYNLYAFTRPTTVSAVTLGSEGNSMMKRRQPRFRNSGQGTGAEVSAANGKCSHHTLYVSEVPRSKSLLKGLHICLLLSLESCFFYSTLSPCALRSHTRTVQEQFRLSPTGQRLDRTTRVHTTHNDPFLRYFDRKPCQKRWSVLYALSPKLSGWRAYSCRERGLEVAMDGARLWPSTYGSRPLLAGRLCPVKPSEQWICSLAPSIPASSGAKMLHDCDKTLNWLG